MRATRSTLTLSCLLAATAHAQQQPGIAALISDPSGANIPNATVRIFAAENPDGEPLRQAVTDAAGRASLPLPLGTYLLQVEATGFTVLQQSITLTAAAPHPDLNLKLTIRTADEIVDVAATDDSTGSSSSDAIVLKGDRLRTLSDNPTTLQQQLGALVGSDEGTPPQFRIDGFSGGRFPPKSSIREIRINQNAFSSQFDQRGNTVIDIFTKPGTDKLHGSAFASGNADSFNARNPFITTQPAYHSTFFDANLTGPLGKATSFFVGYDRNDMENNAAVNAVVLDTAFNSTALAQAIPNPSVNNSYSLRLDRQLTPNNTLTSRYELSTSHQTNSGVGQLVLASQGVTTDTKTNTLQLGNTTIVGAHIVAESRFQYLRTRTQQAPNDTTPTVIVQGSFNGGGSPAGRFRDNTDRYEFQEYLSVDRGKHFFRAGARYRLVRDSNFSTGNYNGQYIFPTLAAYQITLRGQAAGQTAAQIRAAGGGPSQFNLTAGTPSAVILTGDLGAYFEDEWKLKPHFSLISGLRYESQSGIPDHNDPAPRIAFSWTVQPKKFKSPLFNLRGGAGIFYQRFESNDILTATRQNGITQQSYYLQNPDFYPNIPAPANLGTVQPTVYRIAPNFHSAYVVAQGISAERALAKRGNVTVSFTVERGIHQFLSRNVNAPLNGVRPFGGTQNIYQFSSDGINNTHTVSTNYNFQLTKHIEMWGFYAARWRQSDVGGPDAFTSNSYNIGQDYGRTASLARQRLYTGANGDFGRGFSGSFFLAAHTATRFNITTGTDLNGDSIYNDRPTFATDLTRASVVRTAYGNFDTVPIAGQRLIPINYGRAPGLFSLNLQFGKGFGLGPLPKPAPADPAIKLKPGEKPEKPQRPYQLYFSVESQNVLNNVNPSPPVGQLSSPYFGRSLTLNNEQTGSTAANRLISFFGAFRF